MAVSNEHDISLAFSEDDFFARPRPSIGLGPRSHEASAKTRKIPQLRSASAVSTEHCCPVPMHSVHCEVLHNPIMK